MNGDSGGVWVLDVEGRPRGVVVVEVEGRGDFGVAARIEILGRLEVLLGELGAFRNGLHGCGI